MGDLWENETMSAMKNSGRVAVVTGASAGIGEACVEALVGDGWTVIAGARRTEKLEALAERTGCIARHLDVTDDVSVEEFTADIERCDLLVNNAGGALGLDPVAETEIEDWTWMYEVNVLGTLRVTKALLERLTRSHGQVINIGSVAARVPYAGGSGYNAAKHGVAALTRVLRIETADTPLRVSEIDPGRVETDFSLNRFKGDAERAATVYDGKMNLTAADIAEAVRWVASMPAHVNVDTMLIMPTDQV